MRTLIVTSAALASIFALGAAVPVAAQNSIYDRAPSLEQRIDDGMQEGKLSPMQAERLRTDLRSIERTQADDDADGMPQSEARDLNRRYDQLSNTVYDLSGY